MNEIWDEIHTYNTKINHNTKIKIIFKFQLSDSEILEKYIEQLSEEIVSLSKRNKKYEFDCIRDMYIYCTKFITNLVYPPSITVYNSSGKIFWIYISTKEIPNIKKFELRKFTLSIEYGEKIQNILPQESLIMNNSCENFILESSKIYYSIFFNIDGEPRTCVMNKYIDCNSNDNIYITYKESALTILDNFKHSTTINNQKQSITYNIDDINVDKSTTDNSKLYESSVDFFVRKRSTSF